MKTEMIAAVAAAAVLMPAVAIAQTQPAVAQPQTVEPRIVSGRAVGIETKIATGRPYSAETITEVSQTLADGNRIERQTLTRVHRDGQGRTRREQLTADGKVQSIAISDPVSHTSFTLDPAQKIAYRSGIAIVMPSGIAPAGAGGGGRGGGGGGGRGIGGGGGTGEGRGTGAGTGQGGFGGVVAGVPGGVAGGVIGGVPGGVPGGAVVAARTDAGNQKKEDLGQQTIEGVSARGTRTTTTIPAGAIGNLQEIRIVSEQWFSDDLQVLVLTKHSDPRSGETVYRLRNIVRAEPDPSLFTVPSDYTVQQRIVRRPE